MRGGGGAGKQPGAPLPSFKGSWLPTLAERKGPTKYDPSSLLLLGVGERKRGILVKKTMNKEHTSVPFSPLPSGVGLVVWTQHLAGVQPGLAGPQRPPS